MKFVFAVLLLAGLAFAEPESTPEAGADPAANAWYGYYGHGYGYGHRYYGGYGGYYGHPYGYGYYRGKRDAEADPAVLASSSALTAPQVVHPYVAPVVYAGHHAVNPYVAPVVYAGHHTVGPVLADPRVYHAGVYGHPYGGIYGYGPPIVAPAKEEQRKKREADPEADPEADAAADAWYGYYGRPTYYGGWYGRGYGGYGGYYGGWGGYGLHGYRYGWGK